MTRALSSSWRRLHRTLMWALLLLVLTASSALAGRPTVAILGLEVHDASGNIDQPSTTVAHDLTEGLRARAKSGMGPYQLATGSDKELIDEKLINNCDNEAISCMAAIGKNLGADFLIYGRVDKKSDGYAVTINLLNIAKKKFEKSKTPLTIPFSQKDGPSIAAAARRAYNDLVGFSDGGVLVVRTNADRGTVIIDDAPRGNLASGTLTIPGLPESRYRLVIEADGFQRSKEVTITIRNGETTTQQVNLVAGASLPDDFRHERAGTTSSSKSNVWKPIFGVAVVAGIASGGFWAYSYVKEQDAAKQAGNEIAAYNLANDPDYPTSPDSSSCGNQALRADISNFDAACKHKMGTTYGIIGTSVSVVAIAVSGFLAFRSGADTETRPPSTIGGRRTKKQQFSVTPIVSAGGGGATFRLDW